MSFKNVGTPENPVLIDAQSYLENRNFAIVSPIGAEGVSGFVFDVQGSEEIDLTNDITEHFTENGSFLNDHVISQPDKIRLTGFVGELLLAPPKQLPAELAEIQNKLTIIDAYLGEYTPGGASLLARSISAIDLAQQTVNNAIQRGENMVSALAGEEGIFLSRQKEAFQAMRGLIKSKALVAVSLPWGYFNSMMIESVRFMQGEDTEYWSEVSISLKEIRFANLKITNFNENLFAPRVEMQASEEQDSGIINGQKQEGTLLLNIARGLGVTN